MKLQLTPEFYVKKARIELNETETRKEQSLEIFKEWIAKHPFISNVYPDDRILLAYLRSKKYSMDQAYKTFEKSAIALATLPEFQSPIENALKLIQNKFVVVFKERDENGCRNILVDSAKFDAKHNNIAEVMLSISLTMVTVALENETQISGINLILDIEKFTMQHFKKLLTTNFASIVNTSRHSILRIKSITVAGAPDFAATFVDLVKKFLSEKLSKRIIVTKTHDFDISDDNIEDIAIKDEEIQILDKFRDIKINFDVARKYSGYETIGSFRKLDVD